MQKDILREMVVQNQFTSHFCFDRVSDENARLRLTDKAASIGFIFRHIGETINLFAQMLGTPTDVKNTTIGQIDTGVSTQTMARARRLQGVFYGVELICDR